MNKYRRVLAHYHLFKNAGSSVDQLLQNNFGDQWMSYDRTEGRSVICTEEFQEILEKHPEIQAFSSHQLIPPLPMQDIQVFPIIFIRDPIDRIRSAYLFEWQKQLGLDAPKGTFTEYVESKLTIRRKNAIEEFQTLRLSNIDQTRYQNFDNLDDSEILSRAKRFIDELPFIGIVDRFDESAELLRQKISPVWPNFKVTPVKANVLQNISLSLVSKRSRIREELGSKLYRRICDVNRMDTELYEYSCMKLEQLIYDSEITTEKMVS